MTNWKEEFGQKWDAYMEEGGFMATNGVYNPFKIADFISEVEAKAQQAGMATARAHYYDLVRGEERGQARKVISLILPLAKGYVASHDVGSNQDYINIAISYLCDHECTSNCRREGCNCECGEYHISRLHPSLKCKVPLCDNPRQLYAGEDDHDSLGDYCAYHGEDEEGQKEVNTPKADQTNQP